MVDRRPARRNRAARRAGRALRCGRGRARAGGAEPHRRARGADRATTGGEHLSDLAETITALWEGRDDLGAVMLEADARAAIHEAITLLDTGEARVAEVVDDEVVVHQWLKQAILLLFRLSKMETIEVGPFEYADKIPLKHG